MSKSRLWLLAPAALALSALMVPSAASAASATLAEVSSAAQSGQVDKALEMMAGVLKEHPDSAKAHFVQAELLAKKGDKAGARTELAKAESLKPGLPFVKPAAVAALKAQLGMGGAVAPAGSTTQAPAPAEQKKSTSWIWAIVIGAAIFGVLALLRRRSSNAMPAPMGGQGMGQGGFGQPGYGQGGYGQGGFGQQGGGFGSSIMGGLATGAAAGVGFAAGERIIDGMFGHGESGATGTAHAATPDPSSYNSDMGGSDFGISDGGGWDDSSGGGDDGGW
ncbi:tetratricopeptide repeat protein [Novosphingobium sp. FSY-8]|uniref:Tetratricopeptide repeat protein n=1 Tax=Novosphingobium ovatum TaxID=1908523 RepID=A0ABW9X911_9SPHN|nr:tetratricopeptide repeat protein [Novosphingobium ovatum]NBC35021.1 tetratricopeptide repeat protein [Novosphingobium ovatum]